MAGVSEQITSALSRARRAAFIALGAMLFALLLLTGRSTAPPAAQAQVSCPPAPFGLSPAGPGPTRFTMLVRINTQGNVDTYTKPQQGMGDRLRPQDIFVLNTRFLGNGSGTQPPMTPTVAADYASQLRASFPCNRIIALNGTSFNRSAAGYAFTGIDDPNVFALLTDYEEGDWNAGRLTDPTRPAWTDKFKVALPQLKSWNFTVMSTVAASPAGSGKRTGLAPQDNGTWNFGQIAQDLNKKNSRLGARKLGPMSVQTQDACATGGGAGLGARAKQLRLQYTFKFITKKIKVPGKKKKRTKTIRLPLKKKAKPILDNLATQVSFTETPDLSSSMALVRTSAAQAASCVPPALKQGLGAFFFFASDDAMRLLFQQPQIAALRPPATPSKGSTGGITPGGT